MNNKSMRDLEEKIKELSDNFVIEQNKVNKTKQEMDGVSIQISELKENVMISIKD